MSIYSTTVSGREMVATTQDPERVLAGQSRLVRLLHDAQERWGVIAPILIVTVVAVASSLLVTMLALALVDFDVQHYSTMMAIAAIVPALVAPPISYVFTLLTNHLFDLEAQLQHQATHDVLTGVPNRHAIMQSFHEAVKAPMRPHEGLGVLMIDVDHFKSINDNHGHEVGDRVLKLVAKTLARALRRADRIGRYGGEEFLVLTPESSRDGLQATAERLRIALSGITPEISGIDRVVSASIGGTLLQGAAGEDEMNRALRLADAALYRAKGLGRDRVEIVAIPDGTN